MKNLIILSLLIFPSFASSGEVQKIEKYIGKCRVVDSQVTAHMTYLSETGYADGYSNKGITIEFSNNKGESLLLDRTIQKLDFTGFEEEVKIKNSRTKFSLKKSGSMLGGVDGFFKFNKIKKTANINYEYSCYQGSTCGEFEVKLELKDCQLDFDLQ